MAYRTTVHGTREDRSVDERIQALSYKFTIWLYIICCTEYGVHSTYNVVELPPNYAVKLSIKLE